MGWCFQQRELPHKVGLWAAGLQESAPRFAPPVMQGVDAALTPRAHEGNRWGFCSCTQLCRASMPHVQMCASGTGDAARALCCTVALHPCCPDWLSIDGASAYCRKPCPQWTPDGDELLRHLVQQHGWDWKAIACNLEGRNRDGCQPLWAKYLQVGLQHYPCS